MTKCPDSGHLVVLRKLGLQESVLAHGITRISVIVDTSSQSEEPVVGRTMAKWPTARPPLGHRASSISGRLLKSQRFLGLVLDLLWCTDAP